MGTWKGTLGVLVALATGCASSAEGSGEPATQLDAPLRTVSAARSSVSPSIEVEAVEGGFVVNNRTSSPIVCGAVHSIGVTPRKTVQVLAYGTVRIDDGACSVVACEIDMKTASEIAGESEEEWRRALGVSSDQAKFVIFEERGTTSSSTTMLASSCELEPMDDGPRTRAASKRAKGGKRS